MKNSARAFGEIEYSDRKGPERLASVLRTSGHTMPPETRARLQARLDQVQGRSGRPASPTPPPEPVLDRTTPAGRREHVERLMAETQAALILEDK